LAYVAYNGHQLTAYVTTGYRIHVGDGQTIVTPIATLQYTRLHADAYTETGGGGIDLHIKGQDYDFAEVGVGGRISRNVSLSGMGMLRPQFHVNLLHEFGSETMTNTASFTNGGPAFTTLGLKPKRNLYDVGAGLAFAGNETWSIEGIYDYVWKGGDYSAHQVTINFLLHV
jgi:outer membrane autotransporter protein